MHVSDLVIQQAGLVQGRSPALFLLFHGVGSSADNLRGVGLELAVHHPHAWIVSVQAPEPSDLGQGWQWFSVQGVTEGNRAQRVEVAMPAFVRAIERWQKHSGVDAPRTTLVGFSQGAIMALESTQSPAATAGRIAAMAGRFASAPRRAPLAARVHLLHGEADNVVPARASIEAHAQLVGLSADATLDLIPGLGHGIDARMAERLYERLQDGH